MGERGGGGGGEDVLVCSGCKTTGEGGCHSVPSHSAGNNSFPPFLESLLGSRGFCLGVEGGEKSNNNEKIQYCLVSQFLKKPIFCELKKMKECFPFKD